MEEICTNDRAIESGHSEYERNRWRIDANHYLSAALYYRIHPERYVRIQNWVLHIPL